MSPLTTPTPSHHHTLTHTRSVVLRATTQLSQILVEDFLGNRQNTDPSFFNPSVRPLTPSHPHTLTHTPHLFPSCGRTSSPWPWPSRCRSPFSWNNWARSRGTASSTGTLYCCCCRLSFVVVVVVVVVVCCTAQTLLSLSLSQLWGYEDCHEHTHDCQVACTGSLPGSLRTCNDRSISQSQPHPTHR